MKRTSLLLACLALGGVVSSSRAAPPPSPFAEPDGVGPRTFWVLGPFVIPRDAGTKARPGLDRDYLAALGGEAHARIDAKTQVALDGSPNAPSLVGHAATIDREGIVDFIKVFGSHDTDGKVAYAYAEWTVDKACDALAIFGSDDGAAVWLNGRQVHRAPVDRALNPGSDRFAVTLAAGMNRLLVKVDNGFGGWGFALRIFDEVGQRRLEAREVRRHLDRISLGPALDQYLLPGPSFPEIRFRDTVLAERAFGGDRPRIRWFGPDLRPAERPRDDGPYTAVVEATTLDGYAFRRMLTFAKVPAGTIPRLRSPPFIEAPSLAISGDVGFNDAQRAELSRHFWHGGVEALSHGEESAEAALALASLAARAPAGDEPRWLTSGFIQAAEHRLRLRLALEGRAVTPLALPERLAAPAPELRPGTEREAGMRPGTAQKLRAVARAWASDDPHPFVVLVARRGVVFFHEGFNGFRKDSAFYPASIGKTIAALLFARAVDQGLVQLDDPVGSVLPDWKHEQTARTTFRHCFLHVAGLSEHASHGGLYNAYLDNALFVEDAAFSHPGTRFLYNGDDINLTGKALELLTGQSIWRLLHEQMQAPFGEPVTQLDLGFGDSFTALYLAKIGQMILQDGRYGAHRFYQPGFLDQLRPRRVADFAPNLDDATLELGIGFIWTPDPPGPRGEGLLGPNVIGHGASSGTTYRIDKDHDLVVVVGRSAFRDSHANEIWAAKLAKTLADGLER